MASKRKNMRNRTASGQLSHAGEEREFAPTQVKRLRDAALQRMAAPEWGSELGRLYLQGRITSTMYAAGKHWSELAHNYRNAIGVFPVRGSTGERSGNSHPIDPGSDRGAKIARREADQAERFFLAHAVLVRVEAASLVRALCEDNQAPCGSNELMRVRKGLNALTAHWNLTHNGKSVVTYRHGS
jgi:hypothetical protein